MDKIKNIDHVYYEDGEFDTTVSDSDFADLIVHSKKESKDFSDLRKRIRRMTF